MADIHSESARSKNMAAVKSKNTAPEMKVRKLLHNAGFRYALHNGKLAGRPDIKLTKYKALIFVNGCFWHGHDCPRFTWPKTRKDFWRKKINGNIARDERNILNLESDGWRIATVWECALKGKGKCEDSDIVDALRHWLNSEEQQLVVKGSSEC